MRIFDQLAVIRKKVLNRQNVILIVVLSILTTIIFACISMISFIDTYRKDSLNNINGRTLIINEPSSDEKYQELLLVDNIEFVDSTKYLFPVYKSAPDFDEEGLDGSVTLKALTSNDLISIKYGKEIKNSGEAICSSNFYPHDLNTGSGYKPKIVDSLVLKDSELIGKKFTVQSSNEDYLGEEFSIEIVGTYSKKMDDLNTCYISKEDFDMLTSKYENISGYYDENDNYIIESYNEYKNLMVVVDNYKNVDKVANGLSNIGFSVVPAFTLDTQLLKYMVSIPLFICLIIIIICFNIVYSFLSKKIRYSKTYYGILKSFGYTNRDISKYEVLEVLLIYSISVLISGILYFIALSIINQTLLLEFIYYNYEFNIPWLYLLLFILVSIIVIILLIKIFMKKTLKLSIQDLLNE